MASLITLAVFQTSHADFPSELDAGDGTQIGESDSAGPVVRYVIEDGSDAEFIFTQAEAAQPEADEPPPRQPELTRARIAAATRRRRTYRLPGMFGDFYGGGVLETVIPIPNGPTGPSYVTTVASSGAVRRNKIGENNSPVPRHRWIFDYQFFNDVVGGIGDVNQYTFGFEKPFWDEMASVEFRFPVASTLGTEQILGGPTSRASEFGDITAIFKGVLLEYDQCLITGGLGVSIPTSDDARVIDGAGSSLIQIEQQSVHLLPYLAFLHGHDSGWFCQSFLQLDIDVNGNPVSAGVFGPSLQSVGVLQDQTLLFVDLGIGYWLAGNPVDFGTPAIAAIAELHYATTLQDADTVTAGGVTVRGITNRYDVPNLTLGAHIALGPRVSVRPGFVVPLNTGYNRHFDFEAMVQVNVACLR